MKRWRMEKPCIDCPFTRTPEGTHLRKSLRPGRMAGIRRDLRAGNHFNCHKTTGETGDGSNLVCAGALEYQNGLGITSNYQRICERLEHMRETK